MHITDAQWDVVVPFIPPSPRKDGRGRPRRYDREVLDGILWILKTGAQWNELPEQYPPYQTCHRRFQEWQKAQVFEQILTALAHDLEQRGGLDLKESFIDGTFASAKKGGLKWGKRSVVKAQRSWRSEMLMVYLSPSTWPLLLRMKSPWWKQHLPTDLRKKLQHALLEIEPMTAIH